MSGDDWYRNLTWSAEIEAAFNARLARSRAQKAQYLRIQGSILKDLEPEAAIGLLQRCVDEGDEFHIAAAYLDMGHAHYVAGDVGSALACLQSAIEQQKRHPMFRTSAAFDYAMLVALHECSEHYDQALRILDLAEEPFFDSMRFQAEAARAVIYAAKGKLTEAGAAARRALQAEASDIGPIPGHPEVGVMPNRNNALSQRVRAIAADDAAENPL